MRISCINKTDRFDAHDRIRSVGGVNSDGTNWKLVEEDAITGIEDGRWDFYVQQAGRTVAVIIAKSAAGHKYMKTFADGIQPDNLALPECP